jgi:hypothetical protein
VGLNPLFVEIMAAYLEISGNLILRLTAVSPKHKIMKMTTFFCHSLAIGLTMVSLTGIAQNTSSQSAGVTSGEKLIRTYYNAYVKKDWSMLMGVLDPGFTFSSPMDNHISLMSYKTRCWPNCENTKSFEIDRMVVNGDEAFVTYNGRNNSGKLFRNTEYFRFKDGKILSDECFFGPGVNYPNSGK